MGEIRPKTRGRSRAHLEAERLGDARLDGDLPRPAQVRQVDLRVVVHVQQDVVRRQVAVHDVDAVQPRDGRDDAAEDAGSVLLLVGAGVEGVRHVHPLVRDHVEQRLHPPRVCESAAHQAFSSVEPVAKRGAKMGGGRGAQVKTSWYSSGESER